MSWPDNIQITTELIDKFLQCLAEKGRKAITISSYQGVLYQWYRSLPEGKLLPKDAIALWEEELRKKSESETYIGPRVSMLNTFLTYLEDPDLIRERGRYRAKEERPPESYLTRNEYHMLLRVSKLMGRKRAYLLIKTMVCLGIRSKEIQNLTVNCVQNEAVQLTYKGLSRVVKIYEPLRTELLNYAAERGIKDGPIFITKDGLPMQHFLIWKEVKQVCRQMGLPEDKGTPTSLYELYLETQKKTNAKTVETAEKKYLALLQKEEAILAWFNLF